MLLSSSVKARRIRSRSTRWARASWDWIWDPRPLRWSQRPRETGDVLRRAGPAGGPDPAGAAAPGPATTGQQPRQLPPQWLGEERCTGRQHWRESVRQRRTQARLADRQRKLAAHRKSLHGRLAHQIVRQGSTFLLEKVSYRAWQRRYGRSIQRRAPGMFVQILTRLAASAGGQVHTIPTRTTKLSQTCQCGRMKKKPLSAAGAPLRACGHPDAAGSVLCLPDSVCGSEDPPAPRGPGSRGVAGCGVAPAGGVAAGPSHSSTGERGCHGASHVWRRKAACVGVGRPQQVHQPHPRARML